MADHSAAKTWLLARFVRLTSGGRDVEIGMQHLVNQSAPQFIVTPVNF